MASAESVFSGLTRGEEQAGFVALARRGVTPALWLMMVKYGEVASRVAQDLGADLFRCNTSQLQAIFSNADPSMGRILVRQELDQSLTARQIVHRFIPVVVTSADVLATLIVGIATNFNYNNLFFVGTRVLNATRDMSRWRIQEVFFDDERVFPARTTRIWAL